LSYKEQAQTSTGVELRYSSGCDSPETSINKDYGGGHEILLSRLHFYKSFSPAERRINEETTKTSAFA